MINKLLLGSLGVLLCMSSSLAQRIPVNVNQVTGTAAINIPITNIVNGGVSVPVSVFYGSNGARLKDGEGTAGLGFNLSAGGQVSRTLRGLPDDVKTGRYGPKTGWLYNTNLAAISNFTIANNANPINCTNAQTDLNYISSNWGAYDTDTEPDLFQVSAPGLSCQFVFDNNYVIRTIPYQDLQITYTHDNTTGKITSFTVINSNGTTYTFSIPTAATKQTTTQAYTGVFSWPEADVKYGKTLYFQYKGGIQFYDSWLLTKITDVAGNAVTLDYTDMGTATRRSQAEFYVGGAARQAMYVINETNEVKTVSTITGAEGSASLSYGVFNNNVSQGTLISKITYKDVSYLFNYANVIFNKNTASFRNNCLRSVTTDKCNSPFTYFFDYDGESGSLGTSQFKDKDSTYQYTDIWGYYTGIKSSTIAAVNPTTVTAGTLKHIKYYDNGSTTLDYESNDFYNPVAGSVVYGGGARIKTITDYDGISTGNNIVRNYSYLNSLSSSSGVPLSFPQTTFLRPVASSPTIANSTVAADNDLSEEDHTVMYTTVKESQTGKGSSVSEYAVPAGAWDTTVPLGDWTPTTAHAGVQGCSPGIGLLTNTTLTYPFAPNTNYDFERGLLKKETLYNDGGSKVAESTYTYQRSFSPTVINAFRFDDADYARVYSRYSIYTTTSELSTQVDKIVYDASSTTIGQQSTVKLTYGSANHKQVTQQETTNSDGSVTRTYITYSKDYSGGTASTYSAALVSQNRNVPLETYTAVKQPGSSVFKVTGGQLTKYDTYPAVSPLPANLLPSAVYKFVSVTGLIDFVPTIGTNAATPDSRYILTNSITSYDPYGVVKSAVGMDKRPQTQISNSLTHLPLAIFSNSTPAGIGYGYGGAPESFTYTIAGNSYSRAITMSPGVQNYIFSVWIRSETAGSFNITALSSTGASQTIPLAYVGQSDFSWKHYQVKIPVGSFTSPVFTVSFSSSALIDNELLLYPETSNVTTYDYDYKYYYNISQTNTNGIRTYYDRDSLGRVTLTYDQDKQITSRKTYKYATGSLIPDPIFYINVPVGDLNIYPGNYTFSTYNSFSSCILSGATYSWNYGDGSAATTANSHTFATAGTYNVTLTVTIPGVGSNSSTIPIVVVNPPPPPLSLFYTINSPTSVVDRVEFYQGGILLGTFYGQEINGSTIPPGAYTVKVYSTGTDSDISILTEADLSGASCLNYNIKHVYTFTINAAQTFTVTLNPTHCD